MLIKNPSLSQCKLKRFLKMRKRRRVEALRRWCHQCRHTHSFVHCESFTRCRIHRVKCFLQLDVICTLRMLIESTYIGLFQKFQKLIAPMPQQGMRLPKVIYSQPPPPPCHPQKWYKYKSSNHFVVSVEERTWDIKNAYIVYSSLNRPIIVFGTRRGSIYQPRF